MKNNVHSVWSDERIERLKNLWANGMSGSWVAAALGVSRNAALGKVHRLGLMGTKPRRVPKPPEELEAARKIRAANSNDLRLHRRREYRLANPIPDKPIRPLVCEAVEPRHIDLLDLEPGDCRWAYGEGPYTFCGHSKFHGAYCATHYFASVGPGTSSERAATRVQSRVLI